MRARFLALLFLCLCLPAVAQDDGWSQWLTVPPNEGAVAVLWSPAREDWGFSFKGAEGETLDAFQWKAGFPLVKQYRLVPGKYQMLINGFGPVEIDVLPGQITPIAFEWDDGDIKIDTHRTVDWSKFVDEAKQAGFSFPYPEVINPKGRKLEMMAWPGSKPPPQQ